MASKRARTDGEYDFRDEIAAAMQRLVDECDNDQRIAASRIGKTQSTVSEVIAKKRTLRIEGLVALRNALGVSLDEMLGLEPSTASAATPAPTQPIDADVFREFARIAAEEILAERSEKPSYPSTLKARPVPSPADAARALAGSVGVRRITEAPKKRAKR